MGLVFLMLHFKISSILGLPFARLNGVFVGALREHRVHQEDIWDLCHVTGQTGIRRRTCWNTRGFLMFYLNISHQKSLLLKMIFQFQGRICFFFVEVYHYYSSLLGGAFICFLCFLMCFPSHSKTKKQFQVFKWPCGFCCSRCLEASDGLFLSGFLLLL